MSSYATSCHFTSVGLPGFAFTSRRLPPTRVQVPLPRGCTSPYARATSLRFSNPDANKTVCLLIPPSFHSVAIAERSSNLF